MIWQLERAGAGIAGGQVIGASDEFGYKAEQQPISVPDLHATMLHLLGIDHKRLTTASTAATCASPMSTAR